MFLLRKKLKVLNILNADKKGFYKIQNRIMSWGDMDKDPFSWNKRIPITENKYLINRYILVKWRNILITICVGCVWIVIYISYLKKIAFNGLLKIIDIQNLLYGLKTPL